MTDIKVEHLQELIRKYADKTATSQEMLELQDWYRSIHAVEAVEWPAGALDERERLRKQLLKGLEREIKVGSDQTGGPGRIYNMPWIKVAACLVLIACAWAIGQYLHAGKESFISLYNPSGRIQFVRLPDSSSVWLNAASSLRYRKDFIQREIYLEGEAYFEVEKDKMHPFVVHSGALSTTVLGTGFDIRSFGAERNNAITVIRGKVQVENAGRIIGLLTDARQLQWDGPSGKWQTVSADTSQVLSWQQGKLRFQGETMEEITASLERWYAVHFEYKVPAMRQCRYYLNFENTISLHDLLAGMSAVNDMHFTIDPQNHIVSLSGKGCQ